MGFLKSVRNSVDRQPPRIVLHAPEKWGKTSFAAQIPGVLFHLMDGETGLLTLMERQLVPNVSYIGEDAKSWHDVRQVVKELIREDHNYKVYALDAGFGCESLLCSYICEDRFHGNWKDFTNFSNGLRVAVPEWASYLRDLDKLRTERGMSIILLYHTGTKGFHNPEGEDYDQFIPQSPKELWNVTSKWTDAILFGTWDIANSDIKNEKVKAKPRQIIRTSGSLASVSGSRFPLPEVIRGNGPEGLFRAFADAMKIKKPGAKPDEVIKPTEQKSQLEDSKTNQDPGKETSQTKDRVLSSPGTKEVSNQDEGGKEASEEKGEGSKKEFIELNDSHFKQIKNMVRLGNVEAAEELFLVFFAGYDPEDKISAELIKKMEALLPDDPEPEPSNSAPEASEPVQVSEQPSEEPGSESSDPGDNLERGDSWEPATVEQVARIVNGVHAVEMTWEIFRTKYLAAITPSNVLQASELATDEAEKVIEFLKAFYKEKHPKKSKKEAAKKEPSKEGEVVNGAV